MQENLKNVSPIKLSLMVENDIGEQKIENDLAREESDVESAHEKYI